MRMENSKQAVFSKTGLHGRRQPEKLDLKAVLNQLEDGVIVTDEDHTILFINPSARKALNLSGQDVIGKPLRQVSQHPDILRLIDASRGKSSRQAEISLENGQVYHVQTSPISGIGFAIIMQDISHLKQLDQIKNDFVNTVSHDLRSPLTAILGYIELIKRVGPVNEQQGEFIERVHSSVQNITTLINDLLDLGRIEAGFDNLKEMVVIPEMMDNAVEALRNRIEEKNQQLSQSIPQDLPPVLGNPIRLVQMATNLLGNAIKYTPIGGHIAIRARLEGKQVILEFEDDGEGIPINDQPFIFEKFFRASNISAETSGTGLGLSIVKSIVDNHQGRIWVDSTPDRGSTFTVVLPLAISHH